MGASARTPSTRLRKLDGLPGGRATATRHTHRVLRQHSMPSCRPSWLPRDLELRPAKGHRKHVCEACTARLEPLAQSCYALAEHQHSEFKVTGMCGNGPTLKTTAQV